MWFKKLKKKKLQCFLIGMLLLLSSLIFASSLSMVTSINGYIINFYSNSRFSEMFIYNANSAVKEDTLKWLRNNTKVKESKAIDALTSGNDVYVKGKNIKLSIYDLVSIKNTENLPFGINKVSSLDEGKCPGKGEVWITQLLADNFGISLGDKLTFKTKEGDVSLKVSSLINDSLQPSSDSDQIIMYINKDSEKDFSKLSKAALIFGKVKSGVDVSKLEKSLNSSINAGGFMMDKVTLIATATMISSVLGGMCTLASLLIFIASVMLIRFILWNNILKEYKSIGIYKALGFSKGEILRFYITGYALTALIGSILGAALSIPVLNYTAAKVLKYIGDFKGLEINIAVILVTIILFSTVVILNLWLVIKKTNTISPVEALRVGVTSSKKKLTKSLIKNRVNPLALAINDIFKYKKVSVSITLTLSLTISLILLFGNLNETILKMKENTNAWFGIPKSQITISSPINFSDPLGNKNEALKNVLDEVKSDRRVVNYDYGSIVFSGAKLDTKKYNISSTIYNIMTLNSYDAAFKFTIVSGRNPEKYNEAAVSTKILKESGLDIGDYIELSINNKKASYLIVGSYNSLMSNGYDIRILNSAVEKEGTKFIGSEIFLNLKDRGDLKSFKADMNNRFSEMDAADIHPLIKYSIDSIPGLILPMSSLLIIVFMAFSIITILNIVIMNVRDNRRNFGIMKAIGFKSKAIRNRYLYRILILAFLSSLIAVAINLLLSRQIAAAAIGLEVLIISPAIVALLIAIMIIFIMLVSFLSCNSIKKTKPTELMEE